MTYQVHGGSSWGEVRFYILVPLLSTIGVMWLVHAGREARLLRLWATVGIALLVLGIATSTIYMSDPALTGAAKEANFFAPLIGRPPPGVHLEPGQLAPIAPAAEIVGPMRQLDRDLAPELAKGRKVAMDSFDAFPFLVSSRPKSFLLPEDRKFERIVASPDGQFSFIIDMEVPAEQRTAVGQDLLNLLTSMTDGGRWEKVGVYASAILYEWVPNGQQPTIHGPLP